MKITYNRPYASGNEISNIHRAIDDLQLSGDGRFGKYCESWLVKQTGGLRALMTHSATAALEMIALLLEIGPSDEVIMPSFTFVSTANAFVLRGGRPVFVDIREDTLNIDESKIEEAITSRTKAIMVVHYAGVACNMDAILAIGKKHNVPVVEDAAHATMAEYKGKPLGSFGALSAFSFHETKNLICGEGGALLVNTPQYIARSEILREKGTNRKEFLNGIVDKYTWVDIGSSYAPSELQSAFLAAQMDCAERISSDRLRIWNMYHDRLAVMEKEGLLRRPIVPADCTHNAHLYHLLVGNEQERNRLLKELEQAEIAALFHYIPLHSSPGGLKYCQPKVELPVTDRIAACLIRLPLWIGMTESHIDRVVDALSKSLYRTTVK